MIEYDGAYFWIGVDRFMYFDSAVHELPNDHNQNWFFDNLNYEHRQKIWATKVPRFGEIWWFYPRGAATECSHAVIFNVRLKCWYDVELARSAGFYSQIRHYPTWVGSSTELNTPPDLELQAWTRVTVTATVTRVAHGYASGATINVSVSSDTAAITLGTKTITVATADTFTFTCLNAGAASGTITFDTITPTYGLYQHEFGKNKIIGDVESAIQSYFTTPDFGYPTGGVADSPQGLSSWTNLTRVEPDFIQTGDMTLSVLGYEFAQSPPEPETSYTFAPTYGKIDVRGQRRHILLKFESNVVDGSYETGKIIVHAEPGDNRS